VFGGNEDRSARFQSITYGQAAALPVWAYFMKLCYADENLKVSKGEFERPKSFDKSRLL
jgi:penicillin-binding protein 1A